MELFVNRFYCKYYWCIGK